MLSQCLPACPSRLPVQIDTILTRVQRYWGTEEEWMVHRTGLQRMIDARGGIDKLHDNWRLELVVYL